MPAANCCPTCQTELPADAPAGLCPACLLKAGMTSDHVEAGTRTNRPTFSPPTPAELAPHFPQLEILELIGQGGMGAVYQAKQARLDRFVALKILPKDAEKGQEFADRFTREAKAMARLSHPNIIAIHDYGEAGGWYYFVMEFVDGVNLRQAMKAATIKPSDAMAMVGQICDALQYAHEESVVHRDIKPENILLNKKGRVKIADFGLAKLLGLSNVDRHLTATQQVMGTVGYMAPEQMEGSKSIDHRADIYALGVVFYELLTGELPMGRFAPPSQKVQIDVRIDEVVLKSLEREPDRRYQSVSQVKHEVERISAGPGATPIPLSTTDSHVRLAKRLTLLGTALLTIGIIEMTLGLGSISSYINVQQRKEIVRSATSPAMIIGFGLVWIDFLGLSLLVMAAGVAILFRKLRVLAILGILAALVPLASVGSMTVPDRFDHLRNYDMIFWVGIAGAMAGVWGLVELTRPESAALFGWPIWPIVSVTWRFLYPRFLNSTLLTVVTCGIALAFMIGMPWSYSLGYGRARAHFVDYAPSLVAVMVTAGMILFLAATWPFTWRPVLWRPIITLLGGAAILASGIWYYQLFPLDSVGNATQMMFEGWVVSIIAGGILCLNGVWGLMCYFASYPQPTTVGQLQVTHRVNAWKPWLPWTIAFIGIGASVPATILIFKHLDGRSILEALNVNQPPEHVQSGHFETFAGKDGTVAFTAPFETTPTIELNLPKQNETQVIESSPRGFKWKNVGTDEHLNSAFVSYQARGQKMKPKEINQLTPRDLIGIWRADNGSWTFRFREDGTFDEWLASGNGSGQYSLTTHHLRLATNNGRLVRSFRIAIEGDQLMLTDDFQLIQLKRTDKEPANVDNATKTPAKKLKEQLIGTWKTEDDQWIIQFRTDQTFDQSLHQINQMGSYSFSDNSKIIQLHYPMKLPGTGTSAMGDRTFDIRFSGDELTLVSIDGDVGKVWRLKRTKSDSKE